MIFLPNRWIYFISHEKAVYQHQQRLMYRVLALNHSLDAAHSLDKISSI